MIHGSAGQQENPTCLANAGVFAVDVGLQPKILDFSKKTLAEIGFGSYWGWIDKILRLECDCSGERLENPAPRYDFRRGETGRQNQEHGVTGN